LPAMSSLLMPNDISKGVENWEDQIDLPDDKPDGFKQIGE